MSDEKEEDSLTLRDKFAIEMLKIMFTAPTAKNASMQDFNNTMSYVNIDGKHIDEHEDFKYIERSLAKSMRAAYKIADIMRKVRMSAFE
jgi:hypothetical protein